MAVYGWLWIALCPWPSLRQSRQRISKGKESFLSANGAVQVSPLEVGDRHLLCALRSVLSHSWTWVGAAVVC